MTLPTLPPPVDSSRLVDAGNLAALKQAAARNSPQALREAAKQFESLFVSMVLKSARQANFKDPLFGSDQGDLYQEMYDDQMAAELSKGKGLGLADMLVQQLRRGGAGAADPPSPSRPSSGAKPEGATGPGAGPAAIGSTASSAAGSVVPLAIPFGGLPGPDALSAPLPLQRGEPCPTSTEQAGFAHALWPDAQQAARLLGVSPVTLLAQAALETDWGRRVPQDAGGGTSNNLFGIKATSVWSGPAVENSTREYVGGLAGTVKAQFRAYGSTSQCFQDYVALLRKDPRYAAALGTGGDVRAFGTALQQGGYATDPAYASKLTAVAGTLAHALKFAAGVPTTSGSGTLQRR